MTRKALIISNAGESGDENYCQGVHADVSNYAQFLTSDLGGAWLNSEIMPMNRPSAEEVRRALADLSYVDYTFIVFSGHGFISDRTGYTNIVLRKGEELAELELRTGARRRTILLDCCRQIAKEAVFEEFICKAARIKKTLDRSKCRAAFDNQVGSCSPGIVVGYACQKGETANDSASRGGYYSSSIMRSALNWHETATMDLRFTAYSLSVVQAHNTAQAMVQTLSGGTQNPDIDKPRSGPYFPFSVMA